MPFSGFGTNDDAAFILLLRGFLSPEPYADFYDFHRLLGYGWVALYRWFPAVPWYGLSLWGLTTLGLAGLGYALHRAHPDSPPWVLYLVWGGLMAAQGAYLLLHLQYTSLSLLLSGVGVLLGFSSRKKDRSLAVFFLMIGFLLRPAAFGLALLLVFPLGMMMINLRNVRRWGFPLLCAALLAGGNFLADQLSHSPAEDYYDSVRRQQVALIDRDLFRLPPDTSPEGSVVVQAMREWLLGDRHTLQADFLDRFTTLDLLPLDFLNAQTLRYRWQQAPSRKGMLLAQGLLVLCFWWLTRKQAPAWHHRFWMVLWQGWFWLPVLWLTLFYKMLPHVYYPLCLLHIASTLLYIYYVLPRHSFRHSWRWKSGGVGALLLLLVWQWHQMTPTLYRRSQGKQEATRLQTMIARQKKAVVVLGLPAWKVLAEFQSPFAPLRLPTTHRYLALSGWTTLMGYHDAQLEALTGTREFLPALSRLSERRDVRWLSDSGRNALLKNYLRAAYGVEVAFIPLIPTNADETGWYRLEFRP
jgi:hypothetical protein